MSTNTIPIYGQLVSGVVGGYVTHKDQIEGMSEIEAAIAAAGIADASYNEDESKIDFVDKDGNLKFSVSAAPFIKDGMLSKVEIKDGYLVFTFNTESGKSPVSVPVTQIFNPANYYDREAVDGLAKTTSAITVAGGPLADDINDNWPDAWKDANGNKQIPEGITLQEALTSLFLKVINGTVSWGAISWSPTFSSPTVTLSSTSTVEVGSSVTSTASANSGVSGNTRSATLSVSPSTNGYFHEVDGEYVHATATKTVSKTGAKAAEAAITTKKWNGTATDATSHVVIEGENSYVVTQTTAKVTVEALPTTTVYGSTNTKTRLDSVKATLTDTADATARTKQTTNSTTKKVTGSYRYFIGQVEGTGLTITSAMIRALNAKTGFVNSLASGGTEVMSSVSVGAGGNTYIIAVPEGYTIKQILALGESAVNAWSDNGSPKTTADVTLPNGATKKYNVFYLENVGGANANFTNLKLGK